MSLNFDGGKVKVARVVKVLGNAHTYTHKKKVETVVSAT